MWIKRGTELINLENGNVIKFVSCKEITKDGEILDKDDYKIILELSTGKKITLDYFANWDGDYALSMFNGLAKKLDCYNIRSKMKGYQDD